MAPDPHTSVPSDLKPEPPPLPALISLCPQSVQSPPCLSGVMFSGCRRLSPSRPGSCCGSCWPPCPPGPGSSAPSAWHVHASASGSASGGGSGSPGLARRPRLPRRPVCRDAVPGGGGCRHLPGTARALHRGQSQCPCRSLLLRCRRSPGFPGSPSRRCLAVTGPARCFPVAGHGRSACTFAAAAAAAEVSLPGLSDSHAGCHCHRTLSEAPLASARRAPGTAPAASHSHATQRPCRDTNSRTTRRVSR